MARQLVGGRDARAYSIRSRASRSADLTAENAGEQLWLRVERQTLRRLPQSRAVVFTIRTLVRRLDEVAADPGVAGAMAERLREMEPGMAGYKGMPALREPLLAWLDAACAQQDAALGRQRGAGQGPDTAAAAGLSPGITMLAGATAKPYRA